jgi:hypothetical protein
MAARVHFRSIVLGIVLAAVTARAGTVALAQGGTLPSSTEVARRAWLEDCAQFRDERDGYLRQLQAEDAAHRPQRSLAEIQDRYNRDTYVYGYLHREEIYHIRENIHWGILARSAMTITPATPEERARADAEEARAKSLERKYAEEDAARLKQFNNDVAAYKVAQASYESWKADLDAKSKAAGQKFDDCVKRQAQARNEVTPLDDQVMLLLTALILEGSLDRWAEDLPAERRKAEERTKANERIRRSEERTRTQTTQTHDPTASAIGAIILEEAISGAIKATRSRGDHPAPQTGGGGGQPSKPSTGGCAGGACPR